MTMNLYSAGSPFGLFNLIGKLAKIQADVNTSRGTTIVTDILNAITTFNTITPVANLTQSFSAVPSAITQYQGGSGSVLSSLQSVAQNLVINFAANDKTQPDASFKNALQYVINQMISTGASVNKSTVTVAVAAGGSNVGNGAICKSTKRGDGLVQESMLAETIAGTFSASGILASLTLKGQASASNSLGQDWPLGSAVGSSLNSVDANTASMIPNGSMESWTAAANVPDNWIVAVGTPGTTLLQTIVEVQQLVIAGTPTGGTYTISWVNAAGKTQVTTPLAYNASASAVQSALRLFNGLSNITVTATGTTPNFTHTITFLGQGGNVAQITVVDNTTGGAHSITPSTLTAGTAQVFNGSYACQFKSNGAELTELWSLIPQSSLQPNTAYAISLFACADVIPAAGVVTVDLYDGSAVINDAQAVANSITFNAASLLTTWQHLTSLTASECVFRTPAILPALVYVRIRISTAITNTRSMFVDNVGMAAMSPIYPGGPLLALFSGNTAWNTNDTFTITTTNDRAGVLREWCERNFGMSSLGLLLPSSGAPTIPDAVVS